MKRKNDKSGNCLICNKESEVLKGNYFYCEECDYFFHTNSFDELYDQGYYKRDKLSFLSRLLVLLNFVGKKNLFKEMKVMDVGCGTGSHSEVIRSLGGYVTGIDISKEAVEAASKLYPKNKFLIKNIEEGHLDGFDVIYTNHCLEHAKNPLTFLINCRKSLVNGGIIVVRVPNIDSTEAKMSKEDWFHLDYPYHVSQFTVKSARGILKKAGFKNIKVSYPIFELRQTLLYSFLNWLGVKNISNVLKLITLPLQIVFVPVSMLMALFKDSATIEITAYK